MYEPRSFKVIGKRKEAENIFALTLEPADDQPLFDYEAGQFVMLQLLNQDGTVWGQSAYSIANAPCESETSIEFGIKVEGEFTQKADKLEIDDQVMVRGPYGAFVLKEHDGPRVFFAGGIGVAPIRSMVRQLLLSGEKGDVFLFYSSRTREEMAYEAEIRDLATQYSNFYPVLCITRETVDGWEGECERLNMDLVKRYFSEFSKGLFYMCGPVKFMDSVREMLEDEEVDIKDCLHQEKF